VARSDPICGRHRLPLPDRSVTVRDRVSSSSGSAAVGCVLIVGLWFRWPTSRSLRATARIAVRCPRCRAGRPASQGGNLAQYRRPRASISSSTTTFRAPQPLPLHLRRPCAPHPPTAARQGRVLLLVGLTSFCDGAAGTHTHSCDNEEVTGKDGSSCWSASEAGAAPPWSALAPSPWRALAPLSPWKAGLLRRRRSEWAATAHIVGDSFRACILEEGSWCLLRDSQHPPWLAFLQGGIAASSKYFLCYNCSPILLI
jgi:hypothetical protein